MADLTIKCARQILWSLREIEATLTEQLDLERARAEKAEALIKSVQAELLAGGSLTRLRAIVGINNQEDSNA